MQVRRFIQLLLQVGMLIVGCYLLYEVIRLFNGFDQMGDSMYQIWHGL